jgi:flavodoxin/ferredoxin
MKCIVIYFSQTGNTEMVAKAIQAGVKQAAGHCDIAKIKDANPRRLYEYDLIGLGAPCFGVEPRNVSAFINDMRFVGGKHLFAFLTHGGNPEHYFPSIYPRLKRRGLIVIGMRDWYGNCYLLHHLEPYPTKGHPDEIDLKEAEDFGREMVVRSWRISAGETELIPPAPPAPPPLPALGFPKNINIVESFTSTVKFYKEKCLYPKCRLCMDNCPMDGIDLSVEPPVIAKPCHPCEFCARICPTGAIDISIWLEDLSAVTIKYLYPLHLLPALEKAEAEGRFRRLLPKENITPSLDNFGYKLHKKHPQWVIGKGPQ